LSVQGSDGVTLGGMVASEEVLPPFVEARNIQSWQRVSARMLTKMETPVTYFYTDRPRDVTVRVAMPKGVLTHWYPLVRGFGPAPTAADAKLKDSYLDWGRVSLVPDNGSTPRPAVKPVTGDDTWRFARDTDAAFVKIPSRKPGARAKTGAEFDYEKFLFYRGLGTFTTPLAVRSTGPDGDLRLTLTNLGKQPLGDVFAIWVAPEGIRFAALGDLAGQSTREIVASEFLTRTLPLEQGVSQVRQAVADSLTRAGLYPKEARAMVNTWEKSYFRTPGLRLLYTLPRETVDALIPIQIKPAPAQLVRVMVGRTEVLTPETERQIARWVHDLGDSKYSTREAATRSLACLGRLSEPALRRVAAITDDAEVRHRANRLIKNMTDNR
jgi:hypothetical protein